MMGSGFQLPPLCDSHVVVLLTSTERYPGKHCKLNVSPTAKTEALYLSYFDVMFIMVVDKSKSRRQIGTKTDIFPCVYTSKYILKY